MAITATLKQSFAWAVNALLPPRCGRCGGVVRSVGTVCAACWSKLQFLAPPWCVKCGAPFAYAEQDSPCTCLDAPFFRGRAAVAYDEESRALLLGFKHGGRTHLAPTLATWMIQAGRDIWPVADVLVPVPLHWSRLLQRKFNQAALLARAVGRHTGIPVDYDGLIRHKPALSGRAHTAAARRDNRQQAFAVKEGAVFVDKHVVVIDDVWTTGATLEACTSILLRHGARDVSVVAAARRFLSV